MPVAAGGGAIACQTTAKAAPDGYTLLQGYVATHGTSPATRSKLPVVDPEKIVVPTAVLRGQFDGIASMADLIDFFVRLPSPDKQFSVMPGISHASFQQKNYLMVYAILHAWFTQPDPVYTADGH